MHSTYGSQRWWPVRGLFPDAHFEITVGAILAQHTAWANVERALDALSEARVTIPETIVKIPLHALARTIRSSGYYNQKAQKLRAFCSLLIHGYHGDLVKLFALPSARLRAELLTVSGIGPETADSIILYAAGKPIFVIDAYTRRFAEYHRLIAHPL
ncbi:MAG: endonuclease III domain-containing protein, partial [Parcubacteria group bacterium]|nr:endonuclease III domain-containing protein [Parcubacteria group bacterium]